MCVMKEEMESTADKRVEEKQSLHVFGCAFLPIFTQQTCQIANDREMHSNELHRTEASWRAKYAFMVIQ